jgi:hypothetical protein
MQSRDRRRHCEELRQSAIADRLRLSWSLLTISNEPDECRPPYQTSEYIQIPLYFRVRRPKDVYAKICLLTRALHSSCIIKLILGLFNDSLWTTSNDVDLNAELLRIITEFKTIPKEARISPFNILTHTYPIGLRKRRKQQPVSGVRFESRDSHIRENYIWVLFFLSNTTIYQLTHFNFNNELISILLCLTGK